jgi:CubicO group peptidase (beta-lactamase class C family)
MRRSAKRGGLVAAAFFAVALAATANVGTVKKVLSGDVVQIGDAFKARLTGLRAPGLDEPLGIEICAFTKRELEGQTVRLLTWTTDNTASGIVHDDEGYPFVQVFYGKGSATSFNEVLLKKGYARVDPKYLPDGLKHYLDLEKEAREKGLGVWKGHDAPPAAPQGRLDPFAGVRDRIVRAIEEQKIPSVSLAVVRDGEIVWEEAFGLADVEKKIAATPETVYPIASATKPFTATALMILVERGLVDLDRPAADYLPPASLKAFEGDVAGATIRRLLQHTSGLAMFWDFYHEETSRPRPPLETILRRYAIIVSPPGGDFNYSNLGYTILESVVERVSGKPYPDFMAGEVFRPLGLSRTAVLTGPPDRPDVARKYGPSLALVPFCDHATRGASGIHATAYDMASFLLLHLGRLRADQKPILQPRSINTMRTARDPDVHDSSYAFGWETGRRFGYPLVTHGGAMDGCRAHLAMIPSEGLGVAVLINGENVPSIQVCDGIFAALLPRYAGAMSAGTAGPGVPSASPFKPPAETVGTWEGTVKTWEGTIPVRLVVAADGRVEIFRLGPDGAPGEGLSPLKPPTLNRGIVVIHFPQLFAASDASAPSHRTVLGLHLRGNRLSGEANTIASDMSYSFPSYVELTSVKDRGGAPGGH